MTSTQTPDMIRVLFFVFYLACVRPLSLNGTVLGLKSLNETNTAETRWTHFRTALCLITLEKHPERAEQASVSQHRPTGM